MSGWAKIFKFLVGEDLKKSIFNIGESTYINSNQMDLGVTVLSSLGGRHIGNLTWSALDANITTLS